MGLLVMPVVGGAIFLALFAAANPLISDFFAGLSGPALSAEGFARTLFLGVVAVMVWGALRPRWRRKLIALPTRGTASSRPAPGSSCGVGHRR